MRVEGRFSELKGLTSADWARGEKRNRRQQKRSPPMPRGLIQKLFDSCREVFSDAATGVVPSPDGVARVKSVLDLMRPEDVGLTQKMPYFRNIGNPGRPPVTYLHIYESDRFSMGIFCLPPSAVIPLHNHPGMTVFSKLLSGSMHIKSYDWVDHGSTPRAPPGVRLAKVQTDATFTAPCETSILFPTTGGNLHCFTAVTACAVLDVLGPPYDDDEGRHCTYYNAFPFSDFSDDSVAGQPEEEGLAWLEETEKPEEFSVVGAKYMGPRMVQR
ncbi:unnamed protein product [Spirodela intermedia]|uniref:cysteine dioxygenase n=1 Tax=Spirodela intermedia TaxID=51605 RepID=A0A7I8LFN0_SPIIN|nr:unnamed protein product [Spirodela intermedia]